MRVSAVLILPFLAKLGALLMRGLVRPFPGDRGRPERGTIAVATLAIAKKETLWKSSKAFMTWPLSSYDRAE